MWNRFTTTFSSLALLPLLHTLATSAAMPADLGLTCQAGGEPPSLEKWSAHWELGAFGSYADRVDEDCSVKTDIAGAGHRSWVGHTLIAPPAALRASLRVSSGTEFSMGAGEQFVVLDLSNANGYQARVLLRHHGPAQFAARLNYRDDSGTPMSTPASVPFPLAGIPTDLTLEWSSSSGIGWNDGSIRLFVDGLLVTEVTGLSIQDLLPDQIRFGVIAGVDGGTAGELHYKPLAFEKVYFSPRR